MAFDETTAQLVRENRELKVEAETLAGLLKRCARCLPPDHATRKLATDYLRQQGYLSPLRTPGVPEARACEYNGGACQRGGCADGCQAVQMLHQRREQADAHGVRVPDDSGTVQQIDAPDAGPMPTICEDMEKPAVWAYAHLCGYRAALSREHCTCPPSECHGEGIHRCRWCVMEANGWKRPDAAGAAPSREPGDGTPEQEAFCAAHCCWSGHHRDCFRATWEKAAADGVAEVRGETFSRESPMPD